MLSLSSIRKAIFNYQVNLADRLLSGPASWTVLERLNIPGFGTYLIRLYFQQREANQPVWGFGNPVHKQIGTIISESLHFYLNLLSFIKEFSPDLTDWPKEFDETQPEKPHLKNQFFPLADAAVLYSILRHFKPKRYLEIGSGISTKIANQAKKAGKIEMEIVSIDPEPRALIDSICDQVIRKNLEDAEESIFNSLSEGDVLFFDGSHHCFPGNDVVIFFLKILPELPPGVIVHIHDIYWPEDYAPEFLKFLWSEQYLLGSWLMGGGQGLQILFPTAFMSKRVELHHILDSIANQMNDSEISKSDWHFQGTSFWLVKT